MFSRQNKGQNNRISDRILQVGMFAASVATAGILYVLCKFLMINDSSVSGEIILNGTQAEQVVHGSPITAFLFSYFGAFTFLIPLMLLYCFYLVLKNRSRLFVPDFFRVGLRVLGFNILILGLCAAFSRTFSFGVTGGGGVLGDYINLSLLSLMPGMAVSLCSLLLSFIGICVFFAVSPLQLADGIGSFIMRFIDGKKGEEKEVGQEETDVPKESFLKKFNIFKKKDDDEPLLRQEPVRDPFSIALERSFAEEPQEPSISMASDEPMDEPAAPSIQLDEQQETAPEIVLPKAEPTDTQKALDSLKKEWAEVKMPAKEEAPLSKEEPSEEPNLAYPFGNWTDEQNYQK